MIKKRTKAIRNFLALLILLTTGGTQQVWADDLEDINTNLKIDPSDGSKGTAEATNYQSEPNGHCELLKVVLKVTPKPGYYTNLDLITATNGETTPTVYGKYVGDDIKTVDPSEPTKNYSAEREIVIYWDNYASPNAIQITVKFERAGLQLLNGLGEYGSPADPRATITFYEPNAGFDPESTGFEFNPIDYIGDGSSEHPAKTPATLIDNSDGADRWVIAHIEPKPGYWTDENLLFAYEAGAAAARTRTSAPGIEFGPKLTLLKADTYSDTSSDPAVTKDRHDGAGWYYYKLPGSHKFSFEDTGYKYSIINGFAPEIFDLSNQIVTQDVNTNTVTVSRTTDDWTATLIYDKLSLPFDFKIDAQSLPQVQKISIKKGDTEMIAIDDRTTLDALIGHNCNGGAPLRIGENLLGPTFVSSYNCLVGSDLFVSKFNITVPFPGEGTETEPWLIQGAENLSLLAKCVNVGAYDFAGKYVKLDNGESYSYDMSAYNNPESEKCFEPIGLTGDINQIPFCGIFDGNNVTISGINYSFDPGAIVGDLSFVNCIGLFGQIGISAGDPVDCKNGIVKNLRLSDCTFASEYDQACFVGGIAGYIDRGGIYGSTVSSSTVSASDANSHTGAIFGHKNAANVELENNHYTFDTKVSLGSGTSVTTASGYTKRGGFIGTAWDDITINDGAMLYVKKATIAGSTSTNGSAVTFNKVTKGTDRYDKDGDDFYYAVGQPVTLSVTLGSREEKTDIRTFYDELTALTMNDGTTDTDIKDALGFTMPEADATVTATIDESKWFTIPSNNKNWMSFYHEWKDASGASANYIVTDGDAASGTTVKTIEVKTVASVDPDAGTFTLADIQGGVSFSEMPTLFHYADKNDDTAVLPALLKFTPVSPTVSYTQPDKANQFKGTDTGKELAPLDKCYVLNNMGDFIFAYVTDGDNKIPAHHAYIDLEDNPYSARLLKVAGDGTGIDTILRDDSDAVGTWYSLDGRRLDRQPAKKGIYIYKGKKAVIK